MLWWLPSFIAGSITVLITLFIITATGPPIGSTSSIAMDLQNFSIKGGLYANRDRRAAAESDIRV
jgi:hypothetical protein